MDRFVIEISDSDRQSLHVAERTTAAFGYERHARPADPRR
jgi:hypothetical protein